MSTGEPVPDVSQESIAPPYAEMSENNVETSGVETQEASPNGAVEETGSVSEEHPKSPSKPKAPVTSDAKRAVKAVAPGVRAGPSNAVKKVGLIFRCFQNLSIRFNPGSDYVFSALFHRFLAPERLGLVALLANHPPLRVRRKAP